MMFKKNAPTVKLSSLHTHVVGNIQEIYGTSPDGERHSLGKVKTDDFTHSDLAHIPQELAHLKAGTRKVTLISNGKKLCSSYLETDFHGTLTAFHIQEPAIHVKKLFNDIGLQTPQIQEKEPFFSPQMRRFLSIGS